MTGSTLQSLEDGTPATEALVSYRDRIRQAAVRLFIEQSFAGTSMKQLARELQMAPANLYNYFPSKEAILFEVLSSELTGMLERNHNIVRQHGDPVERMWALAYDLVLEDLRSPSASFVGRHGVHGLTQENRAVITDLMGQVRGIWSTTVGEGVAMQVFDAEDVRLTTLSVLSLCSSTTSWYRPGGSLAPETVAAHTAGAVLRILGAEAKTS